MKELSIEEKTKRYDEALELARGALEQYKKPGYEDILPYAKADFEIIFPELAESEDERIRNRIISLMEEVDEDVSYHGYHFDEMLAWLKKQGEQNQKHFELKAGHWYICHHAYCCRADNLTVKEGERFMCEKDGVVKGFVIKEPEKYFKEVCVPAPFDDEQKPSWSEDDEKKLNGICMYLMCSDSPKGYTDWIDWIKSLKERVLPQQKQEWSGDDERIMDNCIEYIKASCLDANDFYECIDWLKSFKPQNTWKPSDEQIEYLAAAVEESNENPVLESLYQDLKKLKG